MPVGQTQRQIVMPDYQEPINQHKMNQNMKHLFTALAFTGFIMSCQSPDETKHGTAAAVATDTTANDMQPIYKPIDTDEALVATALMAAPAESRAGCTVIGYNMAGEFVTFKAGENAFIVLVDDARQEGFNAACYHKNLEPFMARGRALKAAGKSGDEIFAIREAEMKAGQLAIPTGSTLHIYYGATANYDPATFQVEGAQHRYVVYMPWATAASTGLPEVPLASNHPWIMNPGTHRAHIMITPLPDPLVAQK